MSERLNEMRKGGGRITEGCFSLKNMIYENRDDGVRCQPRLARQRCGGTA